MKYGLLVRRCLAVLIVGLGCAIRTGVASSPGAGWIPHGPAGSWIFALGIAPSNPVTIYAGGDVGLYKSTDSGASWRSDNIGFPKSRPVRVTALAVDPGAPSVVYVGVNEPLTVPAGLYRSTDGGNQWQALDTGLLLVEVLALAIEPTRPAILYAGTFYGGLLKSTHGGDTWAQTGLPSQSYVRAIVIDPQIPTTLYVGRSDGPARVFRSTDGGVSWINTSSGLSGYFMNALAIDPFATDTIYAGISGNGGGEFKSTDGGGTWTMIGPEFYAQALVVHPTAPDTLYVASPESGVMKSTNGGATWDPFNDGLTSMEVHALLFSSGSPPTLYTGTENGVFSIQQGFTRMVLYLPLVCVPLAEEIC